MSRYSEWRHTTLPLEAWFVCDKCDGEGKIGRRITLYEPGCGFPHDDVEETMCPKCGGAGGEIDEARADEQSVEK